jgi:hypothetical protein
LSRRPLESTSEFVLSVPAASARKHWRILLESIGGFFQWILADFAEEHMLIFIESTYRFYYVAKGLFL